MPQVDIRPLFTPTTREISITSPPDTSDPLEPAPPPTPPKRSVKITGEQVTNVAFVIAACLGAVISAAFLFKGGEVFQEVAAWPRELFYGRPSPAPHATANNSGPLGTDANIQSSPSPSDTGDPFSPTSKLLNLNPFPEASRPNSRPSGVPFSAPSNFDRLNMMAPPNDTLSRGLGAASTVAQTTPSTVGNAVAASQTAATSSAQTAAVAKGAARATSHKTSSAKRSSMRRLSTLSRKRSVVRTQIGWLKRVAAHSWASFKTSGKAQTSMRGLLSRNASPAVSQAAANIRSTRGVGHGVGSVNTIGVTGMTGGSGGGHSFGRAAR